MSTIPSKHPQSPPRSPLAETSDQRPPAPPPDDPAPKEVAQEIGGPKGPEPTRYGDWEVNGRCSDF